VAASIRANAPGSGVKSRLAARTPENRAVLKDRNHSTCAQDFDYCNFPEPAGYAGSRQQRQTPRPLPSAVIDGLPAERRGP
jgi:hypothetical protein